MKVYFNDLYFKLRFYLNILIITRLPYKPLIPLLTGFILFNI